MALTQDIELFSTAFWQKAGVAGSEITLGPTVLTPKTLGPWLGVLFWFVILAIPLSGIQRPQPITGASYVLFLVASAALLGVMLGRPWIGHDLNIETFGLLVAAATLGFWRWHKGSLPPPNTTPAIEEKGTPT